MMTLGLMLSLVEGLELVQKVFFCSSSATDGFQSRRSFCRSRPAQGQVNTEYWLLGSDSIHYKME
jgi:hypothetical protein